MGKVTRQKARKEWKCSKCGKIIQKGEEYLALHLNYHPVKRRCINCGFKKWETSSSYYVRTIGALQDYIDEYDGEHLMTETELSYIEDTLGELGDRLEDGIDSMPENLTESSIVQERQEQLDAIDDLLDDFPDAEDEITASELKERMSEL